MVNGTVCTFGTSGTVPNGLALTFSGLDNTALLSGIPTLSGTFNFTASASCSNGSTSQGYSVSIAFACDIRIAAEGASFLLAFGKVGLIPDSGATWFLPRLVGAAKAKELVFTAARHIATLNVTDPVGGADRMAALT